MNFLEALRGANRHRLPTFKNAKGETVHKTSPSGNDWSDFQWINATIGELGEFANKHKKYYRGDFTREEFVAEAAPELADTLIYTDLTAMQHGFSITQNVVDRFEHAPMPKLTAKFDAGAMMVGRIALFLGFYHAQCEAYYKNNMKFEDFISEGQHNLTGVISTLFRLADVMDVNLIDVTIDTFNEKSEEVGSPIFIGQKRVSTDGYEKSNYFVVDSTSAYPKKKPATDHHHG